MADDDKSTWIIIAVLAVFGVLSLGVWIWIDFIREKPVTGSTEETEVSNKKSSTESQVNKDVKILEEQDVFIDDTPAPVVKADQSAPVIRVEPSTEYAPIESIPFDHMSFSELSKLPNASNDPVYLESEYERKFGRVHPADRPPKFKYYFGKECPAGYEDVGQAGVLRPKTVGADYPFQSGKEFDDEWTWAHPRLCKGYLEANIDGLYGISEPGPNKTPTRILVGKKFFWGEVPPGIVEDYDDRWLWVKLAMAPASDLRTLSITEDSTLNTDFNKQMSDDRIGILFNKSDLSKLNDIEVGDDYDSEYKWIHPYLI